MSLAVGPNGTSVPAGVLSLVARLYTGTAPPALQMPRSQAPSPSRDLVSVVRDLIEQSEREAAEALLDQLPFGIAVIDAECRYEYANRAARDALALGEYLVLDGPRVRAMTEQDTRTLEAMAAHSSAAPVAEGVPVLISRRTGRGVRVLTMSLHVGGRPLLALFLPDGDRWRVLERLLVRLFGLTGAEADVAVLMVQGLRLDEVARERGITLSTARSHWQTVVWKVGGGNDALLLGILQRALLLPVPPAEHGRDA